MTVLLSLLLAAASGLHAWNASELDAWLASHAAEDFETRLQQVASASLGTPYFDGPLGEGPGAPFDKDPLIDLTRVDCVTFVEQTIALAVASNGEQAERDLQKIRYKDGVIDFGMRNHYFLSDWMKNNAWCRNVTGDLGVPLESATRTIDRAGLFRANGAHDIAAKFQPEAATVKYVPTAQTASAEPNIPNASIVVFVGKKEGIFALHCGLYFRKGGVGTLYHASSKGGSVVGMPLQEYLDAQAQRYAGICVYKITPPRL